MEKNNFWAKWYSLPIEAAIIFSLELALVIAYNLGEVSFDIKARALVGPLAITGTILFHSFARWKYLPPHNEPKRVFIDFGARVAIVLVGLSLIILVFLQVLAGQRNETSLFLILFELAACVSLMSTPALIFIAFKLGPVRQTMCIAIDVLLAFWCYNSYIGINAPIYRLAITVCFIVATSYPTAYYRRREHLRKLSEVNSNEPNS